MKVFQFLCYLMLILASSQNVNARNLGELNIFSNTSVDSIVITILPDIYTCRNVTRNDFDEWKKISSEIIIRDKIEIKHVLNSFEKCNADSVLPYSADTVMKKMKILKSGNKFYTFWFDDDKLDIDVGCYYSQKMKYSWHGLQGQGILTLKTTNAQGVNIY